MRDEPLIPKLRYGRWSYHTSKNEHGEPYGSIISLEGKNEGLAYCLAKQPRFISDEEWETHAKAMSATPNMLKYLIEEWYSLGEEIVRLEKILERTTHGKSENTVREKKDDLEEKFREVNVILEKAGAFDEDRW